MYDEYFRQVSAILDKVVASVEAVNGIPGKPTRTNIRNVLAARALSGGLGLDRPPQHVRTSSNSARGNVHTNPPSRVPQLPRERDAIRMREFDKLTLEQLCHDPPCSERQWET